MDLIARKGGEEGLKRIIPARRLEYVKCKVRKSAGWALLFASVMPPPFPFTPFIMAAAALQYSRARLLATVGVARMVRFSVLGLLALRFGERILKWVQNPVAQGLLIALIVFCTVGSAFSVYRWISRSHTAPRSRSSIAPV